MADRAGRNPVSAALSTAVAAASSPTGRAVLHCLATCALQAMRARIQVYPCGARGDR
ncbi:hypothetical protein ACFU9X_31665 [Streptomyces atratus]|uniref:hypothetical protein n=1 Tax=Streptomyces atratus TaxID=1893 RepID=UPI0036A0D9C6